MLRKFILAAFVLCTGAACAGTGESGAALDVRGTLTLRGNEPFTYPVVTDGNTVWQLVGVDHAVALRLQTHVVHVTGRAADPSAPSGLRAIKVDSIDAADGGAPD